MMPDNLLKKRIKRIIGVKKIYKGKFGMLKIITLA